ncbi:hypothetical protein MTO96_020616 [Rhipicephalus appendiculatus]
MGGSAHFHPAGAHDRVPALCQPFPRGISEGRLRHGRHRRVLRRLQRRFCTSDRTDGGQGVTQEEKAPRFPLLSQRRKQDGPAHVAHSVEHLGGGGIFGVVLAVDLEERDHTSPAALLKNTESRDRVPRALTRVDTANSEIARRDDRAPAPKEPGAPRESRQPLSPRDTLSSTPGGREIGSAKIQGEGGSPRSWLLRRKQTVPHQRLFILSAMLDEDRCALHTPVAKRGVAVSIFPLAEDTEERPHWPAQRLVPPQSRHTVTYSALGVTWQGQRDETGRVCISINDRFAAERRNVDAHAAPWSLRLRINPA